MSSIVVEFAPVSFLLGTIGMTDEQVGRYIRLLCLQCEKGHLPERTMKEICRGNDSMVFAKFAQDSDGNYYNVRMEQALKKGGLQGGMDQLGSIKLKRKRTRLPGARPRVHGIEIEGEHKRSFTKWLEYKKGEFGFKYKTKNSTQAIYKKLIRLGKNDPDTMMRVVMQSIENGWSGIFPLKDEPKQEERTYALKTKYKKSRRI